MALMDSSVDGASWRARAKVSAGLDRKGKITFSLDSTSDGVFVELSPWDAERLARLLLEAAIWRRAHDETT